MTEKKIDFYGKAKKPNNPDNPVEQPEKAPESSNASGVISNKSEKPIEPVKKVKIKQSTVIPNRWQQFSEQLKIFEKKLSYLENDYNLRAVQKKVMGQIDSMKALQEQLPQKITAHVEVELNKKISEIVENNIKEVLKKEYQVLQVMTLRQSMMIKILEALIYHTLSHKWKFAGIDAQFKLSDGEDMPDEEINEIDENIMAFQKMLDEKKLNTEDLKHVISQLYKTFKTQ